MTTRREILTTGAAAGAVAAAGLPAVGKADMPSDAELCRLWGLWKEQWRRSEDADALVDKTEEKFLTDAGPAPWSNAMECERVMAEEPELYAAYERKCKAAKRRHKFGAIERARKLENSRLKELEEQIADSPAQGPLGVSVKLALFMHYAVDLDLSADMYLTENQAVASAYESLAKQTGFDPAAEVAS